LLTTGNNFGKDAARHESAALARVGNNKSPKGLAALRFAVLAGIYYALGGLFLIFLPYAGK
jgi:hypothetical protein